MMVAGITVTDRGTCVTRAMLITHGQEATEHMVERAESEDKHQREECAKWQTSFSQKND